jgi:hypothetical protein
VRCCTEALETDEACLLWVQLQAVLRKTLGKGLSEDVPGTGKTALAKALA